MSTESERKLDEILKLFSDEEILSEFSKRRFKMVDSYCQKVEDNEQDLKLSYGELYLDEDSKQEIRDENKHYKLLIKRNEKINKLVDQIFKSLEDADELPE